VSGDHMLRWPYLGGTHGYQRTAWQSSTTAEVKWRVGLGPVARRQAAACGSVLVDVDESELRDLPHQFVGVEMPCHPRVQRKGLTHSHKRVLGQALMDDQQAERRV
jgi:hypothetical protein